MKVGDLVKGTPASSPSGETLVGIIVGTYPDHPAYRSRLMVLWNGTHRPYPEPRHYLEAINEGR